MDRKQVISIILKNSELFTKTELLGYTNEQLYSTMRISHVFKNNGCLTLIIFELPTHEGG